MSLEEWKVFRHFWSPTYVSKTGPSKAPHDGRPIAEGPLGGLFIDQSFLAIWQTNMINMMLEYYLDKRSQVLTSVLTLLLSHGNRPSASSTRFADSLHVFDLQLA